MKMGVRRCSVDDEMHSAGTRLAYVKMACPTNGRAGSRAKTDLHATSASTVWNESSQTVPHVAVALGRTSRRPTTGMEALSAGSATSRYCHSPTRQSTPRTLLQVVNV